MLSLCVGLVLLAISQTAQGVGGCSPAPAGLVSWWRGEGSTADASGGNNGTIAGTGSVSYRTGVVGQAFVFDGTHRDRVDLGNPAALQLENFTLAAWVKRSSPTVTSFDILGADGSVCGDGACIIGYGRGGYIFALANDGRMILSRTDMDGLFSVPLVTDTNWHHLAVTKSGSAAVFYVDSIAQATPPYDHPAPYTFDDGTCVCSAAVAIGSRGDARGGTFYGMIDEPAVFNRALSAGEIDSIYAAGSAGMCFPVAPPTCVPAADNLVGWWRAESNSLDTADGNHGTSQGGVTFAPGEVGQAFAFDGSTGGVTVAASPSLNVGLGNGFSIEAWIKPSTVTLERPIVEWNSVTGGNPYPYGVHFWISTPVGYGAGPGCLYANIVDTAGHFHWLTSAGGLIGTNALQHVAMTYDKASGMAMLYHNGVMVAQKNLGTFTPQTSYNLYLGCRPGGVAAGYSWAGLMDEVAFYSRVLGQGEIQAVYNAGSAGRCHDAPVILTQPLSQKVTAGLVADFSVEASGTPPLRYQWRFDGADLPGETTSALAVAVSDISGGSYSVLVTNAFGSATSSNAVLTVNHPPVADASATRSLVISCDTTNTTVVLNGCRSSDPDGDPLQYLWCAAGGAEPLATGVVAVVTLPLGTNELKLSVSDGLASGSQEVLLEVITPVQAVERLLEFVRCHVEKPQPLIATLSAALASLQRCNPTAAVNQLEAFLNKVRAQVAPSDPGLADTLIQTVQCIINAAADCPKTHGKLAIAHRADGTTRLKGDAMPGALYIIEASTNLVDWEMIGVTADQGAGTFEFDAASPSSPGMHFYRVVSP